jgi:hypothetical protein
MVVAGFWVMIGTLCDWPDTNNNDGQEQRFQHEGFLSKALGLKSYTAMASDLPKSKGLPIR